MTSSFGIAIDTRPRQSGIWLGYSWLARVFAATSSPPDGRDQDRAVNTEGSPVLLYKRSYGLGIELNEDSIDATVGAVEWMKLAPIGSSESVCRMVKFEPDRPERTRLIHPTGEGKCWLSGD
jgi:hypothetical protein